MEILAQRRSFDIRAFGETWFRCPVCIAVDAEGERDRDEAFVELMAMTEEKTGTGVRYTWRTRSGLWREKEYVLETDGAAARFFVRVTGTGRVDGLRFFDGGAEYGASEYLLPAANHRDERRNLRLVSEPGTLELGYFAPPSYCYPFAMPDCAGWTGVGLAAREGQYNFHQFLYRPDRNACTFEVPLYGTTTVDGTWESQSLLFLTGEDGFDVLRNYARWHYDSGWCRRRDRSGDPAWWRGPIFCGWGEQGTIASRRGGRDKDHATQENYEWMSARLDELGLRPRILIIDDKWQSAYGTAMPDPEKWPDLRGFADREHAKGRRVLLWFRCWYPEGLSEQECVEYLCTACGADPTSGAYRARMRETVRRLLSDEPGCFNCDGFKVDFANCMPLGKYVTPHEPVYGVELLKRMYLLIRDCAKAAKPDALINCSCAHPYFDEIADEVRLHDYDGVLRSAPEVMGYRAALVRAAMEDVLLDTDTASTMSRRDFRRYTEAQPDLGVPCLMHVSPAGDVPLDGEDLDLIRRAWDRWEKKEN